ncbi:MAG TPA: ABATE domain-containing protein [Methylomirabilota bacterium]|nr:ABATE domain-containing protein [Methylomirabilota bacterium]
MATERDAELKMDPANLYREESFTDRRIGLIRVLTPVKADGLTDPSRPVLYLGEAQLLTAAGPLPLTFEIEATSLRDAAERFAASAKTAVERAVQELQELRREAASPIIVPDRVPPGFGKPPASGGGRIQFP